MIKWIAKTIADRRRRRRTAAIVREIVANITPDINVIMSEDQFFDINQVEEVINALSHVDGLSIRANVFQSQVVFHAENPWNPY